MLFENPVFFWGLGALLIPVLIHLFHFRKAVTIPYSNIRLLEQIKKETTQQRKLKKLLVLLSRLLFLLFLVLTFTQPYIPADEKTDEMPKVTLYLDNSYSLSVMQPSNHPALEDGKKMVERIVQSFPDKTKFRLLTNDFAVFSHTYKNKAEIIDLLAQIHLSPITRTDEDVLNFYPEKNVPVFLVSDFQRTVFTFKNKPDSAHTVRLVPIAVEQASNVWVDSVYLEKPWLDGERNTLHVIFRHSGNEEPKNVSCKLVIQNIQQAATTLSLEKNGKQTISFPLTGQKNAQEAMLVLNDPITFDNDFYFTLSTTPPLRVALIDGAKSARVLEKAFGNSSLFSVRTMSLAQLNFAYLQQADVVVLNGLSIIPPSLLSVLKETEEKGTRVVIFPNEKPDTLSYTQAAHEKISRLQNQPNEEIKSPDFRHPFFAQVFESTREPVSMFSAQATLQSSSASAILSYKNNRPFLSRSDNVFLFASPIQTEFSSLSQHALFLPILYRIAFWGKKNFQHLYYRTSTPYIQQADSLSGTQNVLLKGKNELIPSPVYRDGHWHFDLPKDEIQTGFYYAEINKKKADLYAFNTDCTESDLRYLTNADWQKIEAPNVIRFVSDSVPDTLQAIEHAYQGTPLWKYTLLLALLFLFAEILLIRFLK